MATRSAAARNGTRTTEARPGQTSASEGREGTSATPGGKARPRNRSKSKRTPGRDAGDRRDERGERERRSVASSFETGQGRGRRVAERATEAVKTAGSAVRGQITGHPVPAALLGAGLAWLLLEGRLSGIVGAGEREGLLEHARRRYEEAAATAADSIGSAMHSAKESLVGGAETVRDGVVEIGGRIGEYAQRGAAAVGEGARHGYESSRRAVGNAWDEHPLASGLALLAAGVTLGMLLPAVTGENDILGRASDSLTRRAKQAGATLAQRGEQIVSSVSGILGGNAERSSGSKKPSGSARRRQR
jgi:hypothetical protein